MHKFNINAYGNGLDAEIDEFGELNSIKVDTHKVKFGYKKGLNTKERERKKYKKTGIPQLGTTYPMPYDREEVIRLFGKEINIYRRNWFVILFTLLVMALDFCCYMLMLANLKVDYKYILVAIGVAIAVDALPVFFAHNLHRLNAQRKKVLKCFNVIVVLFIVIFLGVVLAYRILCFVKTGTLPNNNTLNLFGSGNTGKLSINDILLSTFFFLVPIATSLFCFIINYLGYNPVEKKIRDKKREILFKREDVNELQTVIKEIELKGDYRSFLIYLDNKRYKASLEMIDSIGEYYKAYVRTEIMKKLKSPAESTDLSKKVS